MEGFEAIFVGFRILKIAWHASGGYLKWWKMLDSAVLFQWLNETKHHLHMVKKNSFNTFDPKWTTRGTYSGWHRQFDILCYTNNLLQAFHSKTDAVYRPVSDEAVGNLSMVFYVLQLLCLSNGWWYLDDGKNHQSKPTWDQLTPFPKELLLDSLCGVVVFTFYHWLKSPFEIIWENFCLIVCQSKANLIVFQEETQL